MNTFTFTDDEVELLIELVATADDSDQEQLVILSRISKVLNLKPDYIVGECGGPEITTAQSLAMKEAGRELFYTGGKVYIAMPSFDHNGNIKFNPKEK